ncbi:hypothetical protein N7495_002894 [Penicillium taxi]|uniref:uncharacterized protein n=1 Tax=Penicillium taxi TaxID=168475 RepID=UPI0025456EED|nr:uncharacterized protein N7495_002894 [Penicillium taxi]KAJ5902366.1 hypothetical protein N7495_002894 [Penicillium taxi]
MSTGIAITFLRPPLEAGARSSVSMAALMQSNNESVAVSGSNASISSPEPISFLKPSSKPETNLSSIASAGLHVSRYQPSTMMSSASAPADRPVDQDREAERHSSHVAQEALGASTKSPGPSATHDSQIHASPEQMQVDAHANDPSSDPYGSNDHHHHSLINSTVASPGPMEESTSQDGDRSHPRDNSEIDQDSNKAFSYPIPTGGINDPRRGLSLPNAGYNRGSPRSPSAKKHRCPYCATEFTRQHNLKSHLLTHSQEKPFVCETCQSRFRRLHDLKRHTKLHTGERPHICPKCGRRFARGDALARHNKGQGGCAGRRSSMGSTYAPDDDYGDGHPADDGMDGLVYAEPERMDEEDERRLNMPSVRKHEEHLPRSDSFHSRQSSTYPPINTARGLYPPGTQVGSGSSTTASQPINMTFPPTGHSSSSSLFTPTNISDSPKPVSPNALLHHDPGASHRANSPTMPQSLPHPQSSFNRSGQPSSLTHSSGLPLPPPQPGAPQLPPPVISSPDARFGALQAANRHTSSHSLSSNHGLSGPAPDPTSNEPTQIEKLWAYVHTMREELTGLRAEVAALRAHKASTNSSTAPPVEVNQMNSGSR